MDWVPILFYILIALLIVFFERAKGGWQPLYLSFCFFLWPVLLVVSIFKYLTELPPNA
ncbi:hypothetical protein LIN78_12005 [Leeia sp. TBRC 13508]|uniref:Uncharacterized protein n=1 Tax=Leeia speluncae TaxID=2884804 RepID=A0ABS8D7V7_9NEIS|nr:hypothetical protein [Leeia speluncae]MCB6184268.1 hypothetical protein [Leeia speluncae]